MASMSGGGSGRRTSSASTNGAGPSSSPLAQAGGDGAPVKASKAVSCNECRRLKLRCSKTWPCDMCVKRRLAHLCPDGVQKRDRPRGSVGQGSPGAGDNGTMASPSFVAPHFPNGQRASMLSASDANAMQGRLESLERKIDLLIAAQAGPSYATRPNSSGSLHDLASIATDPLRFAPGHHVDGAETNRSRGTLSMHADGRSSYVGPHAHSVYLAREDLETSGSGARSPAKAIASRPGSPTPIDLDVASTAPRNSVSASLEDGASPSGSAAGSSTADPAQQQMAGWSVPGFRAPYSSHAIWNQLRPFLPKRELARRLVNVYFASLSFQHDILPRREMDEDLWPCFYGGEGSTERSDVPPEGFHPHKLSLLFAILALGVLFDVKRPQRDPVGRAFYSCSWHALALSNFTESTNCDTVLALVHAALYLTWRRLSRYAESAWPLFGTITSMMTRSGLHRDPAHFDMSDDDRERRRRIFWDVQGVEVLRSLAFCRPPSILDRHVDTRLPSNWRVVPGQERPASAEERAGAFFALKSYHAQLVNRILDECLCTSSTYALTMEFDVRIQRLVRMTPSWLSPNLIPLAKRAEDGVADMEAAYWDNNALERMTEEMRRHIIHLNCNQLRLLLHRGWFSEALQQIGRQSEQQGESNGAAAQPVRFQESVNAVNECASAVIEIITSAWAHYPALVVRWMFFWNGLFSAAVCRGLYAVKRRRGSGALAAWRDLRAAIQLLRHAVDGWKPLEQPLGILLRLHQRAETALGAPGTPSANPVKGTSSTAELPSEDKNETAVDSLELIGDEKRRVRFAKRKGSAASESQGSVPQKRQAGAARGKGNTMPVPNIDSTALPASAAMTEGSAPLAFDSDVLGQPQFDFIPLSQNSDGVNGAAPAYAHSTASTAVPTWSDSSVRMPPSLPTFAFNHDAAQSAPMESVSRGPIRDRAFSGTSSDFLPVAHSADDLASLAPAHSNGNAKSMGATSLTTSAPFPAIPANDVKMPHSVFSGTSTPVPGANGDNTSQFMQMLNTGMGWDDVASWDNFIFDL